MELAADADMIYMDCRQRRRATEGATTLTGTVARCYWALRFRHFLYYVHNGAHNLFVASYAVLGVCMPSPSLARCRGILCSSVSGRE